MKKQRTLAAKRAFSGYCFSIPFLIGFFIFYLFPVIQSIIFSFAKLTASNTGLDIKFIGLENYSYLLTQDPNYIKYVVASIKDTVINVPCVIMFSFFIAIVLNQKFKGRLFARMMMFLPVVISSGIIVLLQNNQLQWASMSAVKAAATQNKEGIAQISSVIINMIETIKISPAFLAFVTDAVSRAYDITIMSGIQILIFLAGLQTIPESLYEASKVEGATSWENFWKITFPMISPIILVNMIYTTIDSLSGLKNGLIVNTYRTSYFYTNYGLGSAMGWFYYVIIYLVLILILLFTAKKMFYEND